MLCDIIMISDIQPVMKQQIAKMIKDFIKDEEFYLGCLVCSEEDHYLLNSGDLVISQYNSLKSNDYLGMCDMEISDFSGMSYLLFKHGNNIIAKIHEVFKSNNYKFVLMFGICLVSMV